MAKNKVLGLNGMAIEFYTFFWYFISEDFHRMIEISIKGNSFSQGINYKCLIILLFKVNEKESLGNWWPIILLNIFYKILAKVL
jgi:hypothetical protein